MIDGLAAAIRERRPFRWRVFVEEALRYVVLDDGKTAASGDYHDDTVTATAIAEQLRLWQPVQMQVVSLTEELGIGQAVAATLDPHAPVIPHTSAEVAQAMAERGTGWVLRNDFGDVIDPWSPTGFQGIVDPRY
jgi:hypothetical protein